MSIDADRESFFSAWRAAIMWDEFSICHDQANFFLSTVSDTIKKELESWYADAWLLSQRDIWEQDERYHRTKKLSDGAIANIYRITREHQFWVDCYFKFHEVAIREELLPKPQEKKDKK